MDKNHHNFSPIRQMLACLLVLFFCGVSQAQTLSLMAPDIANDNGALKARFGVTVAEKPILKGELEDGHELVLKCKVDLLEVQDFWLDDSLSSTVFISSIRFDRLEREFVMTLPGNTSPLRHKNLGTLLKMGWGSIEISLGPWNMLKPGERYSLRLITTMNEKDAPEGVYRLLYFWSWDSGTDNTIHLNFTF